MPTSNFSIAAPSVLQFEYAGWTSADKDAIEIAAREVAGVTQVSQAGARQSFHLYFDPAVTSRDAVVSAVAQIADGIVPGHNWSA